LRPEIRRAGRPGLLEGTSSDPAGNFIGSGRKLHRIRPETSSDPAGNCIGSGRKLYRIRPETVSDPAGNFIGSDRKLHRIRPETATVQPRRRTGGPRGSPARSPGPVRVPARSAPARLPEDAPAAASGTRSARRTAPGPGALRKVLREAPEGAGTPHGGQNPLISATSLTSLLFFCLNLIVRG
jgi:hypothetical protein